MCADLDTAIAGHSANRSSGAREQTRPSPVYGACVLLQNVRRSVAFMLR